MLTLVGIYAYLYSHACTHLSKSIPHCLPHTCGCTHMLTRICTLLHAHTLISTYTPQYFPRSHLRVHLAAHSQVLLHPQVSLTACSCAHSDTHPTVSLVCPSHAPILVSLTACHCRHTLSYTLTCVYSHPGYCSALPPMYTPVCVCSCCSVCTVCHFYAVTYAHRCIVVSLLPATCSYTPAYTYRHACAVAPAYHNFHFACYLHTRLPPASSLQTHTSILHSPACARTCTLQSSSAPLGCVHTQPSASLRIPLAASLLGTRFHRACPCIAHVH